jgi:hypothetical protein
MRTKVREQVPLMNLTDNEIWIGFDNGQGAPSTWYRECGALVTSYRAGRPRRRTRVGAGQPDHPGD